MDRSKEKDYNIIIKIKESLIKNININVLYNFSKDKFLNFQDRNLF